MEEDKSAAAPNARDGESTKDEEVRKSESTVKGDGDGSGDDSKKESDVNATSGDSSCYRYEEDGTLVYTDATTKKEFVLNSDNSGWTAREDDSKGQAKETPHVPDYEFDGSTYKYQDMEGNRYLWDQEKGEWQKVDRKEEEEESEESEIDDNTTEEEKEKRRYRKRKAQPGWGKQATYYKDPETGAHLYKDSADGMVYEWDEQKSAWFPRIDDDFMARYQMNYGFTADGKAEPTKPDEPKQEEEEDPAKKVKAVRQTPQWFQEDEDKTTKVYLSNLPEDTTEEELLQFVVKCGMVDLDIRTNKPKLKMYRDAEGNFKGDALCTYVKVESVSLALQILDGAMVGKKIVKVERAKFEMKGAKYDPKLKPKKLRKKEMEALKRKHEKMFAWEPEKLRGERSKRDAVIVIKNLFDPATFDRKPDLILEYSSHLREHCSKFGTIRKVVVYDKNSEGVAQVFFASPGEADQAIAMIDGRMFFNKRVMTAQTWDGKTKYKVNETDEEEKKRLENWDKFLEGDSEGEDKKELSGKDASVKS